MGTHLIDGEFQSDKYPSCPRGKVPLSTKDPAAQDLIWEYAQRHRQLDDELSADLEEALRLKGFAAPLAENKLWEREREVRKRRELMREETRAESASIFILAGLKPDRMWELANGYWPDTPAYDDVRHPWWLAQTCIGMIRIGWCKRVLAIDWNATKIRGIVTYDDVSKSETMVHAWSVDKAVQYLSRLREMAT
jgi:hypothetical protein